MIIRDNGVATKSKTLLFIYGIFFISFAKPFIKNQIKKDIAIGVRILLKLLKE